MKRAKEASGSQGKGDIHRVGSAKLFLQSSELGLPQPLTRRRVCPLPPVSGGRRTLAGESGVGRVPIPTRGHTKWFLGHTRLRVRGWGSPNSDEEKYTMVLFIYTYFVGIFNGFSLCVRLTSRFQMAVWRFGGLTKFGKVIVVSNSMAKGTTCPSLSMSMDSADLCVFTY